MKIVSLEFSGTVQNLVNGLRAEECIEPKEYWLGRELKALPLGYDLGGFLFLRPDGEVVIYDFADEEIGRTKDVQGLLRALVIAARRYPALEKFIPDQPADARVCAACDGTKYWDEDLEQQPAKCAVCGGLGWTIDEN
ncbi:MAG: hypothetical protein JSS81_02795 [Acidobacteria bacterium]|nr:hypothetical protein [Acidobacteriota bacterium]